MSWNEPDDDRLMQIVETALTRAPGEDTSYIREACEGDAALEARVVHYVQWKRRMGSFLESPAIDLVADAEPFRAGDLVMSRFRILREAGRGGMGIVYEVHDETLDKRVALKCAHGGFDRQLIPEVRHAGEISHPNVCKVFDFHHLHLESGDLAFLSMEFLDGPSLADRLEQGPLPSFEAKKIAIEICRGLYAAHRKGVVHGDLKANNIVLAKDEDGTVRTVITDFGLARRGEGAGLSGPSGGVRGGARPYMAPELLAGGRPSIATDIYALGVVLHQLATGRLPGREEKQKAQHKWSLVTARCMSPEPSRRWPSAEVVLQALDPAPQRLWSVGAAAVIGFLLLYPSPSRDRVRLAVLPFAATAGVRPVADRLYEESAARIGRLDGGRDRSLKVFAPEDLRRQGVDTVPEARDETGATHAFSVRIQEVNQRYVIEAQLIDVSSGAKARQWSAEYLQGELGAVPIALAGVVSGGLHLPLSPEQPAMAAAARPHYELGLRLLRRNSQAEAAHVAFERAAAADPDSPQIHAGIAEACWNALWETGDRVWIDRGEAALRHAERMNPDLPEVLKIGGLIRAHSGWFPEAIIQYRRAIELSPNDESIRRRLGMALEATSQFDDALKAYQEAAVLQPNYFKPHQQLGSYFLQRGKYAQALQYFQRAAELEPEEPGVHYGLGHCYMNLGRFQEAEGALRTSFRLRETSKAADVIGLTLANQGNDKEAIPFFERAIELEPAFELAHMHLAIALERTGDLLRAKAVYRQGLYHAENVMASNPTNARARAMLAHFAARCGDYRRAEAELAQSLKSSPVDDVTLWRAVMTYEVLGRRDESLRILENAPRDLILDLARSPDVAGLRSDGRFVQLVHGLAREE